MSFSIPLSIHNFLTANPAEFEFTSDGIFGLKFDLSDKIMLIFPVFVSSFRTVTLSWNKSRASPKTSKPGPMFAVEDGATASHD